MLKKIDYICLVLYCAVIFRLSSQETLPTPQWFDNQDKLLHAGAYAVLAYFGWRSFRHALNTPIILTLVNIVFCSLYGASDEWHQSFVIGRNSSVGDWLADTLGASIASVILLKYRSRPDKPLA